MEEYERIGRHDEELPDPMPESDHYQHIEYQTGTEFSTNRLRSQRALR